MDHVAIMKKSWGLIPKILDGRKKIESRWGVNKCAPWGKVKAGDRVYFKNSGEPVTVVAEVSKIQEFGNMNSKKVREILEKFGEDDGINREEISGYYKRFKDKKYCLLIYLKNPQKIKPFDIDKTGFGAMAAWICVGKISHIKRPLNKKTKINAGNMLLKLASKAGKGPKDLSSNFFEYAYGKKSSYAK